MRALINAFKEIYDALIESFSDLAEVTGLTDEEFVILQNMDNILEYNEWEKEMDNI